MAPEFYDNLKFHPSWTRLLFQFIFDPRYTLFSRIERGKELGSNATPNETVERRAIADPIYCEAEAIKAS